jgi:hypothetical protein
VKYDPCVKIWPFDVLVLFLKCVQFFKSCVQFLGDMILNLGIIQFLMKKREMHVMGACLLSEEKGDVPIKRVSPF